MTTIQERAQKLMEERAQLVSRYNEVQGALAELDAIVLEAQQEQQEGEDVEESEPTETEVVSEEN
tara:strand:- start:152 stop:346 length:195 start_codon:yes stop_codon:yes gene_type:complete